MRILSRYILKEYLANVLLGLGVFTFVLLLDHLFELVDMLLNKGVGLMLTAQLLFLLLPSSLTLTLPMSTLLGALLTFGRLSETNEITAIRASGLSSWSFIKSPFAFALCAVLFLLPFNTTWAPHAHSKFRKLYLKVLQRNPLVRIEERTFLEIGDYHLYVEKKIKKSRQLRGITIYKTPVDGAPLRIFADEGQASVDPARGMTLDLQNGHIEQVDAANPERWLFTGFKNYVLSIPFENQNQTSTRSIEEMDNAELKTEIQQLRSKGLPYPLFACQAHLRLALAATPLLFVALGIPLAIRVHRGGRAIGFVISLIILVVYYVLLMGGTGIGQRGIWPPALSVWMANAILGVGAFGITARLLRQ